VRRHGRGRSGERRTLACAVNRKAPPLSARRRASFLAGARPSVVAGACATAAADDDTSRCRRISAVLATSAARAARANREGDARGGVQRLVLRPVMC
jgi:hypothetical protein